MTDRRMAKTAILIVAAFVLAGEICAEAQQIRPIDRFRLWNDCAPVALVYIPGTRGINEAAAAVESELRQAGLFDPRATAFLRIDAAASGQFFAMSWGFSKPVFDPASREHHTAETWGLGPILSDRDIVDAAVAGALMFLHEYRRVNRCAP